MRRKRFLSVLWILVMVMTAGVIRPDSARAQAGEPARGRVVVANRASGSISIIAAKTGTLQETLPLPPGEAQPEPMYVVYTPAGNRVWVGDRANDRVVAYDAQSLVVDAIIPVGAGVFHMWADPQSGQLWVVGDSDKTITVVDIHTDLILAIVPIPSDLADLGGVPHDVIVDPVLDFAFVAVNGVEGENDYIVQYSTSDFTEINRAPVGKDAHVSLARQNNQLYVPCQGSDAIFVLNRSTMEFVAEIPVPGAHGAGMAVNGKIFYTTNLPGGGDQGLFAIDTTSNMVISPATDTPYSVPHNIALTPDSRTLFVTHSGPNDKVTIYSAGSQNPLPVLVGEVTVGQNPFGLAYVP